MILAVALVATAAAAAGPIYYQASRTSVLGDSLANASVTGRGYEANETGAVAGLLGQLAPAQQGQLAGSLGGLASRGLFALPVYSVETSVPFPQYNTSVPLVWRSAVCGHLAVTGACPAARGQVIISRPMAAVTGWHTGQQLHFPGQSALTVTGIYRLPDQNLGYWFGRGTIYFPALTTIDAMFTARSTLEQGPAGQQGTAVVDDLLSTGRVTGADVAQLRAAMTAFAASQVLSDQQILVSTAIPATLAGVESSWRSVAVPVALITAQLLVLCLLLLFLAVTDAVEARGPEVALAKLRGQGRWSTVVFALSEPVVLLAIALPAGVLAGWGATAVITHSLLRPGTAVVLPGLAWATAVTATAGGLAAAVLAARRTLRRPVLEEWRRSGVRTAGRGWVVDAILATGAAAGLLDLAVSGQISSARPGTLILLVPGLLGLAVAVIASRLLPVGCRAAYSRTSRAGGLGVFLAIRHVARRPGGVRTTIVLATAFALATFAVSAWSVGRSNQQHVAAIEVGAPAVLTVSVPAGKDLGTIVTRVDPAAIWPPRSTVTPAPPAAPPPDHPGCGPAAFRPRRRLAAQPRQAAPGRTHRQPGSPRTPAGHPHRRRRPHHRHSSRTVTRWVAAGRRCHHWGVTGVSGDASRARDGHADRAASRCPCVLADLDLSPPPRYLQSPVTGSLTVTRLQVHGRAGWVRPGRAIRSPMRGTGGPAALTTHPTRSTLPRLGGSPGRSPAGRIRTRS